MSLTHQTHKKEEEHVSVSLARRYDGGQDGPGAYVCMYACKPPFFHVYMFICLPEAALSLLNVTSFPELRFGPVPT